MHGFRAPSWSIASLLALVAACGGGENTPTDPEPTGPEVASIEVSPSSASLQALDATQQFDATARDEDGTAVSGVEVTWSVSPDSVASVDDDGTARATANGEATVEAEASGVTGNARLTVDQTVASVSISPDSARLDSLTGRGSFEANVQDANNNPVADTRPGWTVADTGIASVDSTGSVTGRREGTTRVVASANDLADSARLVVNNAEPTASIVSPEADAAFSDEESIRFEGSGRDPEDGELTGNDLQWSTDLEGTLGTGAVVRASISDGSHQTIFTATDARGQTDSAAVPIVVLDQENLVETLHLGSSSLAPEQAACSWPDRWASFPRGTELTVQISTALSDEQEEAVRNAVSRIEPLSGGEVTPEIVMTDSVVPKADTNEVAVGAPEDPPEFGCDSDQDDGCTVHEWRSPGVLLSSRSLVVPDQTPQAHAHDAIGHGVFGLCHIDGNQTGTPANSLMSGGEGVFSGDIAGTLTNIDSAAVRELYESSLEPGDQREAFEEAGLINP